MSHPWRVPWHGEVVASEFLDAIRSGKPGEWARRTRESQGLPPTVEDPEVLDKFARWIAPYVARM